MTAGPGSEILLARSREWNFGFAQRKHLKSDLGFARDRRFRLANQERPLSRVTREALARRSSLRGLPNQSAAGTNPGIESPNHFGSQTKPGSNGAIVWGELGSGDRA